MRRTTKEDFGVRGWASRPIANVQRNRIALARASSAPNKQQTNNALVLISLGAHLLDFGPTWPKISPLHRMSRAGDGAPDLGHVCRLTKSSPIRRLAIRNRVL
jgi:hypothetical protein